MRENWLILATGGLFSGILAGLLGIGGGTVLVPLLVTLGYAPIQAVATSSLAILVTSISGSIQNWRMGYFNWKRVSLLGFPAVVTSQIGVYVASRIQPYILLLAFGILLLINIYLVNLRQHLTTKQTSTETQFNPLLARLFTGGVAGILAGLFGVGGGVIMVPLQMLLLKEEIKVAIQTSLGVIVITAISATVGHTVTGNVLFIPGLLLGCGGLLGAQISTRVLPKLPDRTVSFVFRLFLGILSIYVFWQAWQSYSAIAMLNLFTNNIAIRIDL
ncbi:sulfite exporter TauE/SafE family protein [Chroococcidiopsis sp. CCNUC1]|uniref:sulfite exporter TauE/SafE family protein n=1 Tax=Chroococcidiopsis sp. CCNUC1 TaxID=2653189 RepID=UPI0020220ED4|nr:sulfite exporter TauE/SafE family protein [Chroococcidiopsis sp. CCNUC1]URD50412.1 sulfite exporter TauE/SafE family protein [Chroococcidiopsis sp. CCNUC1]